MILHNLRSGYREESMKKKILMIIVFVIVLFFGYKLITDSSDPNQNPGTIPLCHILGHSYFTNDPRDELEDIENGYEFYGTIDKYREVYHIDDKHEDLSTNYEGYLNKDIYYNQKDDQNIYIKLEENKFLKMHYSESINYKD